MPLLKILYYAQERNSHHIYMALIILLVLSEDDVFNKAVHEIVSIDKLVPYFRTFLLLFLLTICLYLA